MSEYLNVWCLKAVAQCARRHMLSKKINKKQYIVQIVKPALKYRRCPWKRENFPKHFSCFTQNTIEGILIYTHTHTNNITNLFTYFSICRKLFFIFLHKIYCECRLLTTFDAQIFYFSIQKIRIFMFAENCVFWNKSTICE